MPKDFRLQSFLSIQYVHGDLCKHLGIDSSTDQDVHAEYLKWSNSIVLWHTACFSI